MNRDSWILSISLCIWLITYNIWQFTVPNVYYVGTAQMILVASWLIHKTTNGIHHVVSRMFLFLAFNNLVDELFFDPTSVEWNEFTMVFFYLLYSLRSWRNMKS